MTLKIEIDVPKGATKIDIGPVLEPILARLVRLERREGYDSELKGRPVLPKHTTEYLAWLREQWEITDRILRLRCAAFQAYFQSSPGWEGGKLSHKGIDWRNVTWYRWTYYDKQGRDHLTYRRQRHYVDLPTDNCPDTERVNEYYRVIDAIRGAHYDEHYEKITIPAAIKLIEAFDHPLIQLARAAGDDE